MLAFFIENVLNRLAIFNNEHIMTKLINLNVKYKYFSLYFQKFPGSAIPYFLGNKETTVLIKDTYEENRNSRLNIC
jgi:hypothetical protein